MMVCAFLKCLFVFRTHDEVMRAFLSSPAIRSFLNTLLDGASLGVVIAAKVSSEMLSTYPSFSAQMLSTPAISMAYITICLSLYLSFRHDVLMSLLLTRIPEALVRRLSNSVPTIPSQYLSYGRIALRSMALAICSLVAYGCLREKMRPRAVDIIE